MTKYRSRSVTVAGETYPSKREAARHQELRLLERAGRIAGLKRQVPFVLADGVFILGEKRKRPALRYFADFVYTDVSTGATVVEDCKGMETAVYRLKKHLMRTVHGIDVMES